MGSKCLEDLEGGLKKKTSKKKVQEINQANKNYFLILHATHFSIVINNAKTNIMMLGSFSSSDST